MALVTSDFQQLPFPRDPVKCVVKGSISHWVEVRQMYQNEIGARVINI